VRISSDCQITLKPNLQEALPDTLSYAPMTFIAILDQCDTGLGSTSLTIHNLLVTQWHINTSEKGEQAGESSPKPVIYLLASLGFFIFVFHCLMKEDVMKLCRIHFCCGRFQRNNYSGKH